MRSERGSGLVVIAVVLSLIVAAAAFFGSPFIKAYELKAAIERGDDQPVISSINFDAVKTNLSSNVPSIQGGASSNYLEVAFKKVLSTFVDPGLLGQAIRQFGPEVSRHSGQISMEMGFKDLSTFEIRSSFKGHAFVTTMERSGLTGWTIVAVELG